MPSSMLRRLVPTVAISLYLWYRTHRWPKVCRHIATFRDRLVVGQLTLDQSTVVRIHVPEPYCIQGIGHGSIPYLVPDISIYLPCVPQALGGQSSPDGPLKRAMAPASLRAPPIYCS